MQLLTKWILGNAEPLCLQVKFSWQCILLTVKFSCIQGIIHSDALFKRVSIVLKQKCYLKFLSMSYLPSICNNYTNWLERLLKSPHSGISLEIYWISILCGNREICILSTFNKKILCMQKFQYRLPRHPMNMDGICKKKEIM